MRAVMRALGHTLGLKTFCLWCGAGPFTEAQQAAHMRSAHGGE